MPFFNPNLGFPYRRPLGPPWPYGHIEESWYGWCQTTPHSSYKRIWHSFRSSFPDIPAIVQTAWAVFTPATHVHRTSLFLSLLWSFPLRASYSPAAATARICIVIAGHGGPPTGFGSVWRWGFWSRWGRSSESTQEEAAKTGVELHWWLFSFFHVLYRWQSLSLPPDNTYPHHFRSPWLHDGHLLIMICYLWLCDWHHAACWQNAGDSRSGAIGGLILHRLWGAVQTLTASAFHLIFDTQQITTMYSLYAPRRRGQVSIAYIIKTNASVN